MIERPAISQADWREGKERVDLVRVASDLLGPPPGRRGDRGRRLWWSCPFHEDSNPSFSIEPGKTTWRCYGCGVHGDAADLAMRVGRMSFPEAMSYVTGKPHPLGRDRPRPQPPPRERLRPPEVERGIAEVDALALVREAAARLSEPEGAEARAYLTQQRGLSVETVQGARLGVVVKPLSLPGRPRGVVVPWFDEGRLTLVKLRQPDGFEPKYREVFRHRPTVYLDRQGIQAGLPLVVVEGELDCLLLGQELSGLASVATLGSASARLTPQILGRFTTAAPWFVATDQDGAGEKAAEVWPVPRSRRVRPPGQYKDWTEAWQGRVGLRRWWSDRFAGVEAPPLFTWDELSAWRWGGADDEPGLRVNV